MFPIVKLVKTEVSDKKSYGTVSPSPLGPFKITQQTNQSLKDTIKRTKI